MDSFLQDFSLRRSALRKSPAFTAISFVGVSAFLMCVAALASYVPARRAAGVDPLEALRAD